MTKAITRDPIYRRRRFPPEVIELCVRWYITYRLSYRDLVAMMAERGITVSHTTILRWLFRYVPEYEKRWARYAQPVNTSWRVGETAIRVRGHNSYLYRAVDRYGKSVDSLLCPDRSRDSARAFFRKAVITHAGEWPRKVNLDGHAASHLAMRLLRREDSRWQSVLVRDCRYLNNVVEQDHRAIKGRCASILGFKSFSTAAITLAGIELAHRIRKRQFFIDPACHHDNNSPKLLWDRVLAGVAAADRKPTKGQSRRSAANAPELTRRANSVRRTNTRGRQDPAEIRPTRSARKVSFGGSLYLFVSPAGGRCWRYNYRFNGKYKTLALGIYPAVSLEMARGRHLAARRLLAAGTDPSLRRQEIRTTAVVDINTTIGSAHLCLA